MQTPLPNRDDRIRDFDFDLDQLLLEIVRGRHPEWEEDDGSCPTCWREVRRLRSPAGHAALLDA